MLNGHDDDDPMAAADLSPAPSDDSDNTMHVDSDDLDLAPQPDVDADGEDDDDDSQPPPAHPGPSAPYHSKRVVSNVPRSPSRSVPLMALGSMRQVRDEDESVRALDFCPSRASSYMRFL